MQNTKIGIRTGISTTCSSNDTTNTRTENRPTENRIKKAGILILTVTMLSGTCGCVRQTETPIIAERTEGAAGQTAPADSGAALPNPSDNQNTSGSSSDSNSSNTAETGASKNFIQTLTEAPERYTADIREERFSLLADTPLEIPSVSQIPRIGIKNAPYETKDCETALRLISEETGITKWIPDETLLTNSGMALEDGSYVMFAYQGDPSEKEYMRLDETAGNLGFTSEDQNYRFSFIRGTAADGTPLMWLIHLNESDGSSDGFDASDLSEWELSQEERSSLETLFRKQAEALLKKLGITNISLQDICWRRLSGTENGKWEPTGSCGLRLTYVRTAEGIPVFARNTAWASQVMPPAQYIEILYRQDGTLLRFKNINREQTVSSDGCIDFLLPFDAAAQIFEQYMRYYQTVWQPEQYDMVSSNLEPHLRINVTEVKFGYQILYDDYQPETMDKGSGTGRLIPVWAFYGTPTLDYDYTGNASSYVTPAPRALTSENRLLLSVNAEDGTIYGKTD